MTTLLIANLLRIIGRIMDLTFIKEGETGSFIWFHWALSNLSNAKSNKPTRTVVQ